MSESKRRPKLPPPVVRDWMRYITHTAQVKRVKVTESQAVKLAGLLSLVGVASDTTVMPVFWSYCALFVHPVRVARWNSAIAVIPPDTLSIKRVAFCCSAYGEAAGHVAIDKGRFKLDEVVKVMVKVRDPGLYVKQGMLHGKRELGVLFHEGTHKMLSQRFRGALGTLARDRDEQTEQLESVIAVVSE